LNMMLTSNFDTVTRYLAVRLCCICASHFVQLFNYQEGRH